MRPLSKYDVLDEVHRITGEDIDLLKAVMTSYYQYVQEQLSRGDHWLVDCAGLGTFFAKRTSLVKKIEKLNSIRAKALKREESSTYRQSVLQETDKNLQVLESLLKSRDEAYKRRQEFKLKRKEYEANKHHRDVEES